MVKTPAAFQNLVAKENVIFDSWEGSDYKYNSFDVWLVADSEIFWILPETPKGEKAEKEFTWHFVAVEIYLPLANKIYKVALAPCISCFEKPQRANIMSWLKKKLIDGKYDLKKFGAPQHLKAASTLIGAAMEDVTQQDLEEQKENPQLSKEGWIYSEAEHQRVVKNLDYEICVAKELKKIFFPESSKEATLSYDCLPKTINQAMGCLFFSRREQLVRLIKLYNQKNQDVAAKVKASGGVPLEAFKDFVMLDGA